MRSRRVGVFERELGAQTLEKMSAAAHVATIAALIGSGCTTYAEQVPEGPGSVAGMAQDPVTVAASNNPMLKTLTQALSGQRNPNVNLVGTQRRRAREFARSSSTTICRPAS